jgi:hypothetical protein
MVVSRSFALGAPWRLFDSNWLVLGLEVALAVPHRAEGLEREPAVVLVLRVVVLEPAGGVPVEHAGVVLELVVGDAARDLQADVAAAGELEAQEGAFHELETARGAHLLAAERYLELADPDLEGALLRGVPLDVAVLERRLGAGSGLGLGPVELQLEGQLGLPDPTLEGGLGAPDPEGPLALAGRGRPRQPQVVRGIRVRETELHPVRELDVGPLHLEVSRVVLVEDAGALGVRGVLAGFPLVGLTGGQGRGLVGEGIQPGAEGGRRLFAGCGERCGEYEGDGHPRPGVHASPLGIQRASFHDARERSFCAAPLPLSSAGRAPQ